LNFPPDLCGSQLVKSFYVWAHAIDTAGWYVSGASLSLRNFETGWDYDDLEVTIGGSLNDYGKTFYSSDFDKYIENWGGVDCYLLLNIRADWFSESWIDYVGLRITHDPIPPEISRNPSTLYPSCTQGQNASSQSFEIWNSGGGTLSYSISDNVSWLSCSPTSGTSTGEHDTITVNYNTSGLSAGNHTTTIYIT
jgi:hypothetical protein